MLISNLILAVLLLVFGIYILMVAFDKVKTAQSFKEDKKKILLAKRSGFILILCSIVLIIKIISIL
jgi:uncharacterized membrane protein